MSMNSMKIKVIAENNIQLIHAG